MFPTQSTITGASDLGIKYCFKHCVSTETSGFKNTLDIFLLVLPLQPSPSSEEKITLHPN